MKIRKLIFSLAALVLFSQLMAQSPRLRDVSIVGDEVKVSINFNDVFIWDKAKFVSIKTFPSDPPWAPETNHELWFGFGDKHEVNWFQFDYGENGKYEVIDQSNVEVKLFGRKKNIIGHLDSETNLLSFNSLDYVPFLQVPKFVLEQSKDLNEWQEIILESPPKEYQWPKGLTFKFKLDLKVNAFYRVRIKKD